MNTRDAIFVVVVVVVLRCCQMKIFGKVPGKLKSVNARRLVPGMAKYTISIVRSGEYRLTGGGLQVDCNLPHSNPGFWSRSLVGLCLLRIWVDIFFQIPVIFFRRYRNFYKIGKVLSWNLYLIHSYIWYYFLGCINIGFGFAIENWGRKIESWGKCLYSISYKVLNIIN